MINADAARDLAGVLCDVRQSVSPTAPPDFVLSEVAERMAKIVERHGQSAEDFLWLASTSGLPVEPR
jgi:hypothetical protein